MDRGVWWATVQGVVKNWTGPNTHTHTHILNPRECSMCTWTECVFCYFWCNVLKISTKSNYYIVSFWLSIALLIFCLKDLSIDVSQVLKSPTIIVFPSIYPFMSVSIYVFSCSYIDWIYVDECTIISLYWSFYHNIVSFFISITFDLKSILSDMNVVTPAFLSFPFVWNDFFHPLTFNLCVSFALKWVSCRQHILDSFFFILSATMCLLIWASSPLAFKVIINRNIFIIILNHVFPWFYISSLFLSFSFSFWGLMIFFCIMLIFSSFWFL